MSLFQYEDHQRVDENVPVKVFDVLPLFIPGEIDDRALTENFGRLLVRQNSETVAAGDSPSVCVTDPEALKIPSATTQRIGTTSSLSPMMHLLPTPIILSTFYNIDDCNSLTRVGSSNAWIQTDPYRLQLVDRHGCVQDIIKTDLRFYDVTLSLTGELILSDIENKCIKAKPHGQEIKTLFKTRRSTFGIFGSLMIPYGVCCLQNEYIAVTFFQEGRVIIYNKTGNIIQEIDNKLFRGAQRVAQNWSVMIYTSLIKLTNVFLLERS